MKAVIFHEHGEPDVLEYTDVETPQPGYGEVQINLKAAALNRLDLFVREGWPGIKLDYPHIPGADGAGIVTAVGEGVTMVSEGDRVVLNGTISCGTCEFCLAGDDNMCIRGGILGEDMPGTYAEYVVVPQENALPLPDQFPFEDAAAASLVFLTAWHSLITKGKLRPGESVLVIGASGGANTAYIQIAKYAGATVYVIGASDEKLALAERLGADCLINRSEEDWSKAIYKMTDRRGVDVVVDNVGAATWTGSLRAVRRGGRMLVVGGTTGHKIDGPVVNYIFGKHISIIGSTMAPHDDFRAVMALVFAGKLNAVVDRTMPLKKAAEAHRLLASGDVLGKLVLTL